LGFFRIWEIPCDAIHGLLGHFSPALPFSAEELASRGFNFDKNLYTYPYIREYMLGEIFGQYAEEARNEYLSPLGGGCFGMRPEVSTQRKVYDLFAGREDERSVVLREGLMRLHDEVLFVEDPIKKGHYHPRISGWQSYIYQSLPEYQRYAFDALYNDFYYYRHNDFWYHEAMKKLPPLLSATDMLVCGEDLGMIPHCVPAVMNQLQILSLEVQRMPKDLNSQFGCTWNYPYLSVGTTSTHDMSGIRAWWEEDRAAMQDFYNRVLCFGGNTPYFCEPYICERILEQHLASPSMLVILPLQDWLSMDEKLRRENPLDERINVPAINPFYWKYRMHMTIEELINATEFNTRLRDKITQSGRQTTLSL
jgi:4-alpha-glucanotransferase